MPRRLTRVSSASPRCRKGRPASQRTKRMPICTASLRRSKTRVCERRRGSSSNSWRATTPTGSARSRMSKPGWAIPSTQSPYKSTATKTTTSPQSKVWLKTNQALFTHGHPEPYGENMSQIYNLLGVPLGEIEQNPNADPKALLDKAARSVDAKLTGYVAPSVMRARRTWAWTIFVVLFVGTGLYLGNLAKRWREARETERQGRLYTTRPTGLPLSVHLLVWLFMLPAVLSILVWRYYPLGRGPRHGLSGLSYLRRQQLCRLGQLHRFIQRRYVLVLGSEFISLHRHQPHTRLLPADCRRVWADRSAAREDFLPHPVLSAGHHCAAGDLLHVEMVRRRNTQWPIQFPAALRRADHSASTPTP